MSHNLNDLRITLIGNKDLKYKLVHNREFLQALVSEIPDKNGNVLNQLAVLKFLIEFDRNAVVSVADIGAVNSALVEIVDDYVAGLVFRKNGQDRALLSETIDLIVLLGLKQKAESLAKLVLILLQTLEDDLLYKALNLLPIAISKEAEDLLIESLIKRLHAESTLFDDAESTDPDNINIEPQWNRINLKLVYKLILNLNYCLNETNIHKFHLDERVQLNLSLLIKSNNNLLSLNIINLLFLFNNSVLLNKLIELIEYNNYSINSFSILAKVLAKEPSLIAELTKIKFDIKLINYLSTSVKSFKLHDLLSINLSDSLLLISLITANNEEFRMKLINSKFNFKLLLFKIINYYKILLKKLIKSIKKNEVNSQLVKLTNNPIFSNTLHLIRSLSRSITLLRTFFIEFNLIDNLIELMKLLEVLKINNENKTVVMSIIANMILDFTAFRYSLITNEVFFKNLLLIHNNNLHNEDDVEKNKTTLIFLQIIKNLMYNETEDNKEKLIESYFPLESFLPYLDYNKRDNTDVIHALKLQQKLTAFDILRNLTSNSKDFNDKVGELIPSNLNIHYDKFLIFTLTNLKLFNPQLTKFNNRNVISLMKDKNYISLVSSISYIENHKFLNNSNNFIHLNKVLFKIWLSFLKLNPNDYKIGTKDKATVTNSLNSIKLSVLWLLINLTWQNNNFNIKLYDSIDNINQNSSSVINLSVVNSKNYKVQNISTPFKRAIFLDKIGFPKVLDELRTSLKADSAKEDSTCFMLNDLLEKIKTVEHQINDLLNPGQESKSRSDDEVKDDARADVNRGGEGFGYDSDDFVEVEGEFEYEGPNAQTEDEGSQPNSDLDEYWVN